MVVVVERDQANKRHASAAAAVLRSRLWNMCQSVGRSIGGSFVWSVSSQSVRMMVAW